jgi:RecA/RadA recombinase
MKASQLLAEKYDLLPIPIPALQEITSGIPTRLITEIASAPGCGKSTLSLQIIAQAQKLGRPTLFADAERAHGFVPFATTIGVDCEKLEYLKEPYAELLLQGIVDWANAHKNGVIVVDSVGSLHGREEAEKDIESKSIGIQSRMIAKFCRTLTPIIDDRNHALIMLNHIYTDPTTTAIKSSGGAKLAYAVGLSIWLANKYGMAPKRSSDGTKTIKFIEAEIRTKAKYQGAFEGRKALLELIPKQGFVGEFVSAPAKKKPGRPKGWNKVDGVDFAPITNKDVEK